jgi:hypothetical protein
MICFGLGWRALQKYAAACWLPIQDAGNPPASRHHWLRGDIGAVKNQTAHFISIVNWQQLDCASIDL